MQMAGALAAGLIFSAFSVPVPMGKPLVSEDPFQPVALSSAPDAVSCGTAAEIAGPAPLGNRILAVRNGPGTDFRTLDFVGNGDQVIPCDAGGDDNWLGIVYVPKGGDAGACASLPDDASGTYSGPCRAGWIPRSWILKPISG